MKKYFLLFVFVFSIVSLAVMTNAQELDFNHIISNSADWRDVYSSMLFSSMTKKGSSFLASERHAAVILNSVPKPSKILLVSSKSDKYALGFPGFIKDKGYSEPVEFEFDNVNIGIAKLMPDIKKFIIIDDRLGYSAISVAPYAVSTNSYVLFVSTSTVGEVDDFLSNVDIEEVILYGQIDRSVKDTLSKYNPKIIDKGDRFSDNVEIVKEFRKIKPVGQVLFSNGEFIEREIMRGREPVIFIGKQSIPPQTADYLKNSDIKIGVLIGNELVNVATNIRRELGISTFVKFAQGARNPSSTVSAVEGLDLFYTPIAETQLEISSLIYNKATKQLEVTYRNPGRLPVYIKGTITINGESGNTQRVGDINPIFIAIGDFKTITYSNIELTEEKYTADIFTIFGENPLSLEKFLEGTFDIGIVEVIDNCNIEIKELIYYKSKELFSAKIKNIGSVGCFVDIELIDVVVNGYKTSLGMTGVQSLESGKSGSFKVRAKLDEADIIDNEFVDVIAFYGQRENSLTKQLKQTFELIVKIFDLLIWLIWIIVIIFVVVLVWFILKGKKCDKCKTRNNIISKKCRNCSFRI